MSTDADALRTDPRCTGRMRHRSQTTVRGGQLSLRTVALVIGIVLVSAATYGIPFFGPMASLLLIWLTHEARRLLWPSATERQSIAASVLAWVGLWLPGLLYTFTPLHHEADISFSTSWLIIPLCGPDNVNALVLPAAAATAVCLLGLASARCRPWPWVLAAWLAPWAHLAVFSLIPHSFIC